MLQIESDNQLNFRQLRKQEITFIQFNTIMKYLILFTLIITGFSTMAQTNPNYDEALAKKLGADDYGMKEYVLVLLKSGTKTDFDEEERNKLFAGHQANMLKWEEAGKLAVAGPFFPNYASLEGIFILDVPFEEVQKVLSTDPAIAADALSFEAYRWYGSAALSQYIEDHYKIEKIKP